eukprot:tig00000523_g1823.t1
MCKDSTARAYKDPHTGKCQKLAECCIDPGCNTVVAYAQNNDPLTCPPVATLNKMINGVYVSTAKIVAAKADGRVTTLTPVGGSSTCDFKSTVMEYGVDEYFERYNSGRSGQYARVYDKSTAKFKCCKIGISGSIDTNACSAPYARLDDSVHVAAVEEFEDLDALDVESEDPDVDLDEADLELASAAELEAAIGGEDA